MAGKNAETSKPKVNFTLTAQRSLSDEQAAQAGILIANSGLGENAIVTLRTMAVEVGVVSRIFTMEVTGGHEDKETSERLRAALEREFKRPVQNYSLTKFM